MNNLIPDEWLKKHGEKYLAKLEARKEEERRKAEERNKGKGKPEEPKPGKIVTSANLDLSQYIQIPDSKIIISRKTLYVGDRLNWNYSHFKLAENGLFMPSPAIAMPYVLKVRDASQGKKELFYADGKKLNEQEVQDLWSYLSLQKYGARSWLNAKFEINLNSITWDTTWDIITTRVENGSLKEDRNRLEDCVDKDCYADLDFFNRQGMPTRRFGNPEYSQGQNFYFRSPRNGRVARLDVCSGGLILDCNRYPTGTYDTLGVFGCAEGGSK